MKKYAIAIAVLVLFMVVGPYLALHFGWYKINMEPRQEVAIERAIKQCVDVVHDYPADNIKRGFFKRFDAQYNVVTGGVRLNVTFVGDQSPLYKFDECMASHGYSLGYATQTK